MADSIYNKASVERIDANGCQLRGSKRITVLVVGVFVVFNILALLLIVQWGMIEFPLRYVSPVLPSQFLMGWLYWKLTGYADTHTSRKEYRVFLGAFWLSLIMLNSVFIVYMGYLN